MEKDLQISSRHFELPGWASREIEKKAAGLESHFPRLIGCHVVVEGPSAHHQQGGEYSVTVDVRVPGSDPLVASKRSSDGLEAAITGAFRAASRRVEDYAQKRRGNVKQHS